MLKKRANLAKVHDITDPPVLTDFPVMDNTMASAGPHSAWHPARDAGYEVTAEPCHYPYTAGPAPTVYWTDGIPPNIGWECDASLDDTCSMQRASFGNSPWMEPQHFAEHSPMQSSCCEEFYDSHSFPKMSPKAHSLHEDLYTPPAEQFTRYGEEYFRSGNPSRRGHCGIALQDVQAWQDHSSEGQFWKESTPFLSGYEAKDAYPTPPEVKLEPGTGSPYSRVSRLQSEERSEDERTRARSPLSTVALNASASSGRSRRISKSTKPPRNKLRARPARTPKRPNSASALTIVKSATANSVAGQCPYCQEICKNNAMLQKHITNMHTRPFSCVFDIYGCSSTFGTKNEWKRHVASQHLRLSIWRCDLEGCQPHTDHSHNGGEEEEEEEEQIYNDFNRKDLFTQHLRRMHTPVALANGAGDKGEVNAWLTASSTRCFRQLRPSPPRSVCGYCAQVFEGPQSWETRMEHVGRHLESGLSEKQAWKEDTGLRQWMVDQSLLQLNSRGNWELAAPVTTGSPAK